MSNHMSHPQFTHIPVDPTSDAVYAADGLLYADHDNATSSTSEAPLPSPNAAGSRKRKTTKHKATKPLSRSASTPQLRDDAMSDLDDKKRNKLGYQRISIACAHCRRRKIRCVLSDGDPNQRCQNCIRLKKECVFYPVDQQTAMENRGESASKTIPGIGPPSIVSSSPSNQGLERPLDPVRDMSAFPSLPSNAPSHYEGLPLQPGSALSAQGPFAQTDYAYRGDNDARPWAQSATISPVGDSSASGHADGLPHGFSQYPNASAATGDYSPFPTRDSMQMAQHQHHANHFDFHPQRDGMVWQQSQPLRSMSYGQIEHMANNQRIYDMPMQTDERSQNTPLHYAPPLDVRNVSNFSHNSASHSAPVRPQGPGFGQPHAYGYQQGHGVMDGSTILRSHQGYDGGPWYPDQSNFGQMQEEPESYGNTHSSQPG